MEVLVLYRRNIFFIIKGKKGECLGIGVGRLVGFKLIK